MTEKKKREQEKAGHRNVVSTSESQKKTRLPLNQKTRGGRSGNKKDDNEKTTTTTTTRRRKKGVKETGQEGKERDKWHREIMERRSEMRRQMKQK